MSTKHTPAPWLFVVADGCFNLKNASGDTIMCDTTYYPWTPDSKEDWQLIAAAPELLEALQEVVRISDRDHNAWFKAKAAILKALGETT